MRCVAPCTLTHLLYRGLFDALLLQRCPNRGPLLWRWFRGMQGGAPAWNCPKLPFRCFFGAAAFPPECSRHPGASPNADRGTRTSQATSTSPMERTILWQANESSYRRHCQPAQSPRRPSGKAAARPGPPLRPGQTQQSPKINAEAMLLTSAGCGRYVVSTGKSKTSSFSIISIMPQQKMIASPGRRARYLDRMMRASFLDTSQV